VAGFTTGSRGEVPGKKENLGQEITTTTIITTIIIIINLSSCECQPNVMKKNNPKPEFLKL
jgi:hypothetical protein